MGGHVIKAWTGLLHCRDNGEVVGGSAQAGKESARHFVQVYDYACSSKLLGVFDSSHSFLCVVVYVQGNSGYGQKRCGHTDWSQTGGDHKKQEMENVQCFTASNGGILRAGAPRKRRGVE